MEEYSTDDTILGRIRLPETCPVRIRITPLHVFLYVGPRDFQWDRATGVLMGSGTVPCDPAPPAKPQRPAEPLAEEPGR